MALAYYVLLLGCKEEDQRSCPTLWPGLLDFLTCHYAS